MTCDDVRELAGAYALRALTPDEQHEVEAHLAECELHPDFVELRATARLLERAVPEREPSAALRDRVLAIAQPDAAPTAFRARASRRPMRVLAPFAAAAVLAVVAVGLLAWNLVLLGGSDDESVIRTSTEGPASRLVYVPGRQLAALTIDGLQPAPEGHVYQVWVVRGGTPRPDALFDAASGGRAIAAVNTELQAGDTVAITLEPRGGSSAPTTKPFVVIPI